MEGQGGGRGPGESREGNGERERVTETARDRAGDVEKREAERKALHDVFLRLAAERRKLF